jgi:hypothetical protein
MVPKLPYLDPVLAERISFASLQRRRRRLSQRLVKLGGQYKRWRLSEDDRPHQAAALTRLKYYLLHLKFRLFRIRREIFLRIILYRAAGIEWYNELLTESSESN